MTNESPDDAPRIVSLQMDEATFAIMDALRRRYFPAARNHIAAHITLFHALPAERNADINNTIAEVCRRTTPFDLVFSGVRSLGRGVAVVVESVDLLRVRAELAREWRDISSPQDDQGFRPHITIQNKVTVESARVLLAQLTPWEPMVGQGMGITLSRYKGGPWETVGTHSFAAIVENAPTGGTIPP